MAVDTRSKRASSVGMLMSFILAPPAPDGTISQGDRQHTAWTYSGILAGALITTATPAWRTYAIEGETRILVVEGETRIFAVEGETRILVVY